MDPKLSQRDMNCIVMFLATLAVSSLVVVTWALTRISSWIVPHDEVWGKMDREGAELEHYIAEAFHAARQLPTIEAIVGVVFLFLLWRALFTRQRAGS
ncbi:MAG: hypothetical protein V4689_06790 [Verrucomicrobiota bacterium]